MIVIYVFKNQKKNKDNFLSKEMLINNNYNNYNNYNKCKLKKLKKLKKIKRKKYKDVDELMMKAKIGETIYDVTSVIT